MSGVRHWGRDRGHDVWVLPDGTKFRGTETEAMEAAGLNPAKEAKSDAKTKDEGKEAKSDAKTKDEGKEAKSDGATGPEK